MRSHTKRSVVFGSLGLAIALAVAPGASAWADAPAHAGAIGAEVPRATLTAFRSEAELQRWLKRRKEELERRQRASRRATDGVTSMPAPMDAAPAPPPAPAATAQAEASSVTGAAESITNVQEQGVDEGDIVKVRGDILVILRRGRLFTVSIAGGGMRPIDSINAYPPDVNARSDWYDEMLISGNRVIVIGYSYGRGGTEVNRFHLSRDGRLRFEDAYHLRSNDYYSSRNYASRLIGTKLIIYSPMYLNIWNTDPMVSFPAYRRWRGDTKGAFQRMVTASHVYYSPRLHDEQVQAIHTVSSCDLAAEVMRCSATSVLGPAGRTFYVSPRAVYVWVNTWSRTGNRPAPAMLYRLPLDGSAPSAIGVAGAPVDQFSFREDGADGMINVLVRASGRGDAMWMPERPEGTRGGIALLRLPISAFGDGTRDAANARYRVLPMPRGEGYDFHNRFVGNHVLYGTGNSWGRPTEQENQLVVVPVRGGAVTRLDMPHGIDRIEVMGRDAVVVGSDRQNVIFSEIELSRGLPRAGDRYVLKGAAQAETRSHGFFYKPESAGGDEGVLGLPVARPSTPAYRHLFQTSAAVVFIRRDANGFLDLGDLAARSAGAVDDNCVASCVDWYGNARPIFYGSRTFALMGYELVEGNLSPRRIREVGRVNFAPGGDRRVRHPEPQEPGPDDNEDDQDQSWLGEDE